MWRLGGPSGPVKPALAPLTLLFSPRNPPGSPPQMVLLRSRCTATAVARASLTLALYVVCVGSATGVTNVPVIHFPP